MNLKDVIKNGATVVDVRTAIEFLMGHAEGSVNIPLNELEASLPQLKTLAKPLVLCCASGGRSGQAYSYLTSLGLDCLDAGSWLNVNGAINN